MDPFRHASSRTLPDPNTYRVPGTRIFAGEYPGATDEAKARERLGRFLDAGITFFLDLTMPEDGLPPYDLVLHDEAAKRGLTVARRAMPVRDMRTPTPKEMRAILDTIDRAHRAGHGIYVHCWGGIGRTGTVVACHFARWGMTGGEALDRLADLWRDVWKSSWEPRSPQTDAQCAFVRDWVEDQVGGGPASSRVFPRYLREQLRGALVGLAVGDALGAPVEFGAPGSFAPVTGMRGGGPHRLSAGEWTDDTSMALCLAESLVERRGMDARDQMRRYVRWWRDGHLSSRDRCFDIGNQTREALAAFERTDNPISGPTAPGKAGNGCIMRLAPVPMWFVLRPRDGMDASAEQSRTTHGSRVCLDACRYLGGLILGAFHGFTKAELLASRFSPVEGYWDEHPLSPEILEVAEGSFIRRNPPEIAGTGHVVRSLEAALWAFHRTTSFGEGALLAVSLGEDADTTAAVYGQLAGAFYGETAIPEEWRATLARREIIDRLADQVIDFALREG